MVALLTYMKPEPRWKERSYDTARNRGMVIGNNAFGDLRGALRGSGLFFIHCDTRNMGEKMSDLVERLRATTDDATVNPDGPAAANRIEELESAIYHYVNHVVSYEGTSFIDVDQPWAKLIDETWEKQAALEGEWDGST